MEPNTSSHGTPSSCSMTATTSASVIGGTDDCSERSSSTYSGATRSGRVESICPSLPKVGPSCSNASRSCCGARTSLRPPQRAPGEPAHHRGSEHPRDLPGAPVERVGRVLGGAVVAAGRAGVHHGDGAAGEVRDAVGDVAEQELLASAHAVVADDQDVGVDGLGRVDDQLRDGVPGHDARGRRRPQCLGGLGELRGGAVALRGRRALGQHLHDVQTRHRGRWRGVAAQITACAAVPLPSVATATMRTGAARSAVASGGASVGTSGVRRPGPSAIAALGQRARIERGVALAPHPARPTLGHRARIEGGVALAAAAAERRGTEATAAAAQLVDDRARRSACPTCRPGGRARWRRRSR